MKKYLIIGLILALFFITSCAQEITVEEFCLKKNNDKSLSLSEAREIAINSECGDNLKEAHFCNGETNLLQR